jgi:hypothetical protein
MAPPPEAGGRVVVVVLVEVDVVVGASTSVVGVGLDEDVVVVSADPVVVVVVDGDEDVEVDVVDVVTTCPPDARFSGSPSELAPAAATHTASEATASSIGPRRCSLGRAEAHSPSGTGQAMAQASACHHHCQLLNLPQRVIGSVEFIRTNLSSSRQVRADT